MKKKLESLLDQDPVQGLLHVEVIAPLEKSRKTSNLYFYYNFEKSVIIIFLSLLNLMKTFII